MKELVKKLNGRTVCSAESCTGGRIASLFTSLNGSSTYFKGGVVAYCNQVKIDALGVPSDIINNYGVVSRETAISMAKQAKKLFKTDIAISTTGYIGNTGGDKFIDNKNAYACIIIDDKISTLKFENLEGSREVNMNYIISSIVEHMNISL